MSDKMGSGRTVMAMATTRRSGEGGGAENKSVGSNRADEEGPMKLTI